MFSRCINKQYIVNQIQDKNGAKENASEEITPADDSKKDSDKNDKKAQSTPEKKKKVTSLVIIIYCI